MKLSKINKIEKIGKKNTYDITVEKNHNFFINDHLIHNCDYTGEIMIILINLGEFPFEIGPGDRIAQAVMMPVYPTLMTEISEEPTNETRGSAGFGSTGV